MKRRYRFDYSGKDGDGEKGRWSARSKLLMAVLFFLFLALFPKYTPFTPDPLRDSSFAGRIFSLYFFIASQTLGIVHEAGHGLCYILPCPKFLMIANGTIFQLISPLLVALYYRRRRNRPGYLIGLFFTGFSLYYTSWYISTSNQGPILPASKSFLGVDAYHDFNYILSTLDMLEYYHAISVVVKFISFAIMYYSVAMMFLEAFDTKRKGPGE